MFISKYLMKLQRKLDFNKNNFPLNVLFFGAHWRPLESVASVQKEPDLNTVIH